MKMLVTPQEYFGSQDVSALTHQQYCNAIELLYRINLLRQELGIPFTVNSGYRSPAHNVKIGGSPNSSHCQAAAIDLSDRSGQIYAAVTANNNAILIKYDLYAEDRSATPTWCHLSIIAPKSGNRVFKP